MAHPVITPQISAHRPHAPLHTPSGGRHNPTEQGRAPDPKANHSISTVIPASSTAASRSFQCETEHLERDHQSRHEQKRGDDIRDARGDVHSGTCHPSLLG